MKSVVARILMIQLAIGVLGALFWGAVQGSGSALAALGGAAINMLLAFYVAAKMSFFTKQRDPRRIIMTLYRAEAMKLVIAALLLSAAIVLFPAYALPLVSVFAISTVAYWFALIGSVQT